MVRSEKKYLVGRYNNQYCSDLQKIKYLTWIYYKLGGFILKKKVIVSITFS